MTLSNEEKTSLTDDERIENIFTLPPPEHLIRFFPIQCTPVEKLVTDTRRRLRDQWPHLTTTGEQAATGVYGDPTLATRAKGAIIVEAMVTGILREIDELRQAALPTP